MYIFFIFYHVFVFIKPKKSESEGDSWESDGWSARRVGTLVFLEISDVCHSDVSINKPACLSFISHTIFMAGTVSTLRKANLPSL